jgi:hypothetical protein
MLAEKLRRHTKTMTLPNYIRMLRQAADDLDAEARALDADPRPIAPGRQINIIV